VSAAAAGLGLFAVLVVLPRLADSDRSVAPRVAAGAHLMSLLGWALMPVVWLACLGSALGASLGGIRTSGGGCLLGLDRGQWELLGYVPAVLLLAVLVRHVLLHASAARRAEMGPLARSRAVRRPTTAGEVWVLCSDDPVAFASGLWRCRAVVTSGLLALLDPAEREAVCEHEAAHVRLGHPRLLVVCGAIAGAYGRLPPVRRAWDGLRRQLEAAADDEAARVTGATVLLSALVHVAAVLGGQASPTVAPGIAGADQLRWRIARLEHPGAPAPWPTALAAATAAATAAAISVVGCLLTGVQANLAAELACLVVVAMVGLRPTWAWGRHG